MRHTGKEPYGVRFTDQVSGSKMIVTYTTAKRAKEVVEVTQTRHAGAKTSPEYLGRNW